MNQQSVDSQDPKRIRGRGPSSDDLSLLGSANKRLAARRYGASRQDTAGPLPGSKEGSFPGSRTINLYFTPLSLQIGKVIPFTFVFLEPLFERFPSYIQILAVLYLSFHCFQKYTYRSNFGGSRQLSTPSILQFWCVRII